MKLGTRTLFLPALCALAVGQASGQEHNLVLKVLQTDQLFDSARSGNIESRVSCSISGPTSPAVVITSASLVANVPWVSDSYPGLRMHCEGQGQPLGWRHVLNTALVVASDGRAYVVGCDAGFRWSKCKGLQSGAVFRASSAGQGLRVYAADSDGKSTDIDFHILTSRPLGPEQTSKEPEQTPKPPEQAPKPPASAPAKTQPSGMGTVTVLCAQPGAQIYVDGKFAGNPPVMLDLPEGPHTFEVKSAGYAPWQQELEVLKNSTFTLRPTLEKAQ